MGFRYVGFAWALVAMALVYPVFASWTTYADSGLDEKSMAAAVAQTFVLVAAGLYAAVSARSASLTFFLAVVFDFTLWVLASFAVGGGSSPTRAAAIVLAGIAVWSALEIMNRSAKNRTTYLS